MNLLHHDDNCWKVHPICANKKLRRCIVVEKHMAKFLKVVERHAKCGEDLSGAVRRMKVELAGGRWRTIGGERCLIAKSSSATA